MQKICAIILLSALASNYEALPQTKWSRPVRNPQGQLTRERRQFPFGDWVPLSHPCPTCRPFADPLDVGLRGESIGLTPPRPPTVTRQIHGEGNFFPQDESSILSVPPPPPSAIPRHPINNNANFQFSGFGEQFSSPLPVPQQQIQFLSQPFLQNQQLLVNGNQQILPGISAQNNLFSQEQSQQINNGKVVGFNSEFKTQKIPENMELEQNNRQVGSKQGFSIKPQPFTQQQQQQQQQQQNQQSFLQQHSFGGQQQGFGNQQQAFGNQQQGFAGQQQAFGGQQQAFGAQKFGNSILTPPPAPKNLTQDIVIPGLDKEEIQLLYVPVETLRQKGTPQEQLLTQQPQNVQFFSRGNSFKRPANNIQPTEQTLTQPKGHFVTQNGNGQGLADSVSSSQPFPTSVTPSTVFLQHFSQTPQPFVSATPVTPTVDPFVTPASVFQKFSPFTPETTLSHLSTVPNTIQFSQSDVEFGTTPKTLTTQGEIINGKSQFPGVKNAGFTHEQGRPFQQQFANQHQMVTQQPQLTMVFNQDQKEVSLTSTHFPHHIDQQQIALQKQQEQKRLLQQQHQKELEEQRLREQQRKQKELEEQRILQRQKELEEQRLREQQRKQKELEEQRILQRQKELEEQRLREQQRKQKELEEQRILQQRQQQHQKELEQQRVLQQQQKRQKELEHQLFLQKQKELEEQRLLQQRQKELEEQRFIQKQKELEEQRLLQERQKELEEQRFLQHQQRLKELEEQRFLQEQRQKELENQRRLQLQRQKELEEKRRLQLKQKEEEKRLRIQQQQKELEQQKLLKQQQELQRQKEENYKKFQNFKQQYYAQQQQLQQQQQQQQLKQQQQQQQLQQQQQQTTPSQVFQQTNRHVLPANDQLNFIPQLEKESADEQQLVPHQPPLSVFFKGNPGVDGRITDVLRELRSSNTITVLDQYFEKMPKVFVGPAGLAPPPGYEKFELPYLSNIESNRIERRIGKLPFFVAPLNFVPPPGYAKIPFPAPHVGSVVVSSESNPAMNLKSIEKGSAEVENVSGAFPVVGPELPGLINNLDTETTTVKPSTYVSTPSLPQTTAQLRNRRPNNSLYKPQTRKPITRTRTTTVKPEEEVTQPVQKIETTEAAVRKPFNRFLNRRRQQAKTTTEAPLKVHQDGKNLENRHYSVEVYQKEKNQIPRTQQKSDVIQSENGDAQFNQQFEQHDSIDRITPSGHGVFEVRPTPDYSKPSQTIISQGSNPDYADVSLQTFEDGPFPTGSAKTITQELYNPNAVGQSEEELNSKTLGKADSTQSSVKYPASGFEDVSTGKFSDVSPTVGSDVYREEVFEGQVSAEPTPIAEYEKQEGSSERYDSTEAIRGKVSFTPGPTASAEDHTNSFLTSNEQYTSAFVEISKPHHIPGFVDSSQQQKFSNVYPTPEISVDLQAPHEQHSQELEASDEVKPTQNSAGISNKFPPTASSNEQYLTEFDGVANNQHVPTSQISPTVSAGEQYTRDFSGQVQNSEENNRQSGEERIPSFINVQDLHSTAESPVSPQQYPTAFPSQATDKNSEYPVYIQQSQPQVSPTAQPLPKITVNPSVQTYTTAPDSVVHVNEETQTGEGHGQEVANNLPNDRLKLPNPSIVRVRTRVRGKSRGQVNFAASQTTTQVPFTRSGADNRQTESAEHEVTTKVNSFREYNPVKTSKFNQYRGVRKPVRTTTTTTTTTTTEATVEYEPKPANVYTIRPPRRPFNPSTVSTKRIRRPTTPIPSAESGTEAFGISTVGSQPQSEHSDISPSGVSNDVYFEQSSLSPVKHKFRKHFGSANQKNDVGPVYVSTAFPPTAPTYAPEEYSEESNIVKDTTHTSIPLESSEKYPEWNPSESGFDVSGIVLTTARTPVQEEETEVEEPKKSQDSKKAFDPDLEKKTGRRRIRVRVHKRPHENFETAESQNLRTVANVLVPPTTTYKPNDEPNIHQLAKNADFSFGGQKLFGSRSREYFRKRLNLTEGEQPTGPGAADESSEKTTESKSFLKKAEKARKTDFEDSGNQSSESGERIKVTRPKFRGFVRKVVKHGGATKEADSDSNQVQENEESGDKHETREYHTRQTFRGGFNHTGRVNGTRHKTFVRYVKKNKIRQHETESAHESSSQEPEKEEPGLHQTTEIHTPVPVSQETISESQTTEMEEESQPPVTTTPEQVEVTELQQPETTEEAKETQEPIAQTTQATESEVQESSSQQETVSTTLEPATPQTHFTGLYLTQRPKFYQTFRPVFPRPNLGGFQRNKETESTPTGFQRQRETESTSSGFHRNRETDSTHTGFHRNREADSTTQNPQEKRAGYSRYKYGKPTGFGSTSSTEKSDEIKKVNEHLKNKNLHTLEVRKYLRSKNREGAFSQFSKNKYFTSEKTETTTDEESIERESGEITTERVVRTSPSEPKTTEPIVASTEVENETTENDEETEVHASTTETITSSEEESSEDDITSSFKVETTTEAEIPTTFFHTTSTETPEKVTEQKIQTTETVEAQRTEYEPDIYRFSKNSFSFDEAEKFTGTKNRAHVRNITAAILENTASFSAPGVENRPDFNVITQTEELATETEWHSDDTEKTEEGTTEYSRHEMTTEYPETETVPSTDAVTKAKIAKVLKTSTTTKISHETEICYRGKCIRTKSENPDEDLKLLVDSASNMKTEKTKT